MKIRLSILALMLAFPAVSAQAAALSRTDQDISYLFDRDSENKLGNEVNVGVGYVTPNVKGSYLEGPNDAPNGNSTGSIAQDFPAVALSAKIQPTENITVALGYEQPFGIDIKYNKPEGASDTSAVIGGLESHAIVNSYTALVGYKTNNNFWVYGGPVYYDVSGTVNLPQLSYSLNLPRGGGWGYVAGVAWEKPEIALRAALTYHSTASYTGDVPENIGGSVTAHPMTVKMPQSVNFDFQTGIMPKTLLITGVRWVNWKQFSIDPAGFHEMTQGPLAGFDRNSWQYKLGIGRQLTDKLGAQLVFGYDTGTGNPISPIGPTDEGYYVQLGGKYHINKNIDLSGGVQYHWYKNQTTAQTMGTTAVPVGRFENMDVWGGGVRLTVRF